MDIQSKNIIIIGSGSIGKNIAQRLQESHNIKIIDVKKSNNSNHFQSHLMHLEKIQMTPLKGIL